MLHLTTPNASGVYWTPALIQVPVQTANYTASPNVIVPVSTASGNVTVTLPTGAPAGSIIAVKMVIQGASNTVTVDAVSGDVFNKSGGGTSITLTLLNQGVILEYQAGIWMALSDDMPLSQLEAIFVQPGGDIGGTAADPEVISVFGGRIPLASASYIDLCTAWNNGSPVAAVPLTVTFTSSSTTATVTSGSPPASGAIISDSLSPKTTFTASGSTLTLSQAATASGSAPAWAGMDCTTALQDALNYFQAQDYDGTVEFSRPGIYLINGTPQSGTAFTRTYNGQVVFPARALSATQSLLGIRIKGAQPYAGFGGDAENTGGVILLCCPGTAAAFDAIPGYTLYDFNGTAIVPTFEDITVRCTTNPQGTAINGQGCAGLLIRGACNIDTISPAGQSWTGTGYGLQWPMVDNQGMLHQSGELQIAGYPNGMSVGEHLVCEYLMIADVITAIVLPWYTGHPVKLNKVCLQGILYGISNANGAAISQIGVHLSGFFDIGDVGSGILFNDPNDYFYGDIQIAPATYSATETPGLGFATRGGRNASIRPYTRPQIAWPSDTFGRIPTGGTTYTYGPGATDRTLHIWSSTNEMSFPSGGGMKGISSGLTSSLLKYNTGRNSPSRVVRLGVTLGNTGYNVFLILGKVISGSSAGNMVYVQASGGAVSIQKVISGTTTTLATASSVVAANTAYTIDAYVSNPYSAAGAFTVTVFVSGAQVATWTMGSGDSGGNSVTQLADTEQFFTQDGIGIYDDTTSLLTEFAVLPSS